MDELTKKCCCRSFYPVSWLRSSELWEPRRTRADWTHFFNRSYAVHFYHGSHRLLGRKTSCVVGIEHRESTTREVKGRWRHFFTQIEPN